MDEEPVFVDEAALDEHCGEGRAADIQVAVELHLELRELLADVACDEAAVPLHSLEVVEKTIFGFAFQIRAKSSMDFVADGSDSAVGQYLAMTSYIRRP